MFHSSLVLNLTYEIFSAQQCEFELRSQNTPAVFSLKRDQDLVRSNLFDGVKQYKHQGVYLPHT